DMSETSSYTAGSASETVGYFVRGGADDWCYNDSVHAGHHIFGITPETGNDFWPPQSDIIPFAQNMLYSNKYMSMIAGAFVNPESEKLNQQNYDPGQSGNLKVVFKNKGLLNASNVKITLTPVSAGLNVPVQQFSYANINSFLSDSCLFDFSINSNVLVNTALRAELKIKMDTAVIYSENVNILIGTGNVALNDNAEGSFSNWTTNQGWAITSSQSNSPTHSFTDSPGGDYLNDANNSMTTSNFINVSSLPVTILSFYHKYSTEAGYDFCNVEVSKDNSNVWQKIKSYNGSLPSWKYETFDITQYAAGASEIKVRFTLVSDVFVTEDGWYVDDIKIINYNIGAIGVASENVIPLSYSLEQNYPNPFNPVTNLEFGISKPGYVSLKVFDVLGKEVKTLVNEIKPAGRYDITFDGSSLSSGVYFYKLSSGDYSATRRMLLIK
ncbi:MAG: T9SS type A sorting domain-containing protein, partial [bacterium]